MKREVYRNAEELKLFSRREQAVCVYEAKWDLSAMSPLDMRTRPVFQFSKFERWMYHGWCGGRERKEERDSDRRSSPRVEEDFSLIRVLVLHIIF